MPRIEDAIWLAVIFCQGTHEKIPMPRRLLYAVHCPVFDVQVRRHGGNSCQRDLRRCEQGNRCAVTMRDQIGAYDSECREQGREHLPRLDQAEVQRPRDAGGKRA